MSNITDPPNQGFTSEQGWRDWFKKLTDYLNKPKTATTATAGTASALPATPAGYYQIQIGGVNYKVPYYNV